MHIGRARATPWTRPWWSWASTWRRSRGGSPGRLSFRRRRGLRLAGQVEHAGVVAVGGVETPEQVDFLRYRPVLANRRLKEEFGYTPRFTSREAFVAFLDAQGVVHA